MAQAGILFWKKNAMDIDNNDVTITITDATASNTGQAYTDLMRNRNQFTAWRTTGSNDAANTQVDIDLVDEHVLTEIILVNHNLGDYTIQYWNGSAFVDFSTAINVSAGTATTTRHTFNEVSTSQIRMVITGTITPDEDKKIGEFILTDLLGQLTQEPRIVSPTFDEDKRVTRYNSGKYFVKRSVGGFGFTLRHQGQISDADLDLFETLYERSSGFLCALHGFDTSQFSTVRRGYRLRDIFLMRLASEYTPEWKDGHFDHGINYSHRFLEIN